MGPVADWKIERQTHFAPLAEAAFAKTAHNVGDGAVLEAVDVGEVFEGEPVFLAKSVLDLVGTFGNRLR